MELYAISGMAILLFAFLTGICVQVIRIEKEITKISMIIEYKVTTLFHPDKA